MSATFSGRLILHSMAVAIMTYGYTGLGNQEAMDAWIRSQYGGHFQFLTIQGLAVAWLTMTASVAQDLIPSFAGLQSLKRMLLMIALPLSVVISSIYWPLIYFFPHLIMNQTSNSDSTLPAVALFRIPLDVDLALHAVPAISLLCEFVIFEQKYRGKVLKWGAPLIAYIFAAWYGSWVEHCAKHNNGTFPYPFLTDNTFEIRVGIYLGAATLAFTSFWLFNSLHA